MSLSELHKLNACRNIAYRKIFGMRIWESVKCVLLYCEHLNLTLIVHKRNLDFSVVYFVLQIVLPQNVSASFVGLEICVMNMT